jgi:predicted lipoprotein with Yx(FWY)xxD motif
MTRFLSIVAVSAGLALAGCGGDGDDSSDSAPAADETAPIPGGYGAAPAEDGAVAGTTIKASGSEFGTILFGPDDGAIYLFDKEKGTTSECYGACAEAWPPVLTEGEPQAGSGAKAGLLGTTERTDGSTQVTYAGHPLYYYAHDPPGEVLCHDVEEFGGLWLVIEPSGVAVS